MYNILERDFEKPESCSGQSRVRTEREMKKQTFSKAGQCAGEPGLESKGWGCLRSLFFFNILIYILRDRETASPADVSLSQSLQWLGA